MYFQETPEAVYFRTHIFPGPPSNSNHTTKKSRRSLASQLSQTLLALLPFCIPDSRLALQSSKFHYLYHQSRIQYRNISPSYLYTVQNILMELCAGAIGGIGRTTGTVQPMRRRCADKLFVMRVNLTLLVFYTASRYDLNLQLIFFL